MVDRLHAGRALADHAQQVYHAGPELSVPNVSLWSGGIGFRISVLFAN